MTRGLHTIEQNLFIFQTLKSFLQEIFLMIIIENYWINEVPLFIERF